MKLKILEIMAEPNVDEISLWPWYPQEGGKTGRLAQGCPGHCRREELDFILIQLCHTNRL